MPSNHEIVTGAFAAWMKGTGYVTSIFADDMTWEIAGRSAASREVLEHPPVRTLADRDAMT
jgi:ketosteroid isomerase-like protein